MEAESGSLIEKNSATFEEMNQNISLQERFIKIESKSSHIQTKKNAGLGFRSFKMGTKSYHKNKIIDPLKRQQLYDNWKKKYIDRIEGISKVNSDIILQFIRDMEKGINVAKRSKKGRRSPSRLNSLSYHLKRIAELSEEHHNKNLPDLAREEAHDLFDDMKSGRILTKAGGRYVSPDDYIKDFICFWNWFRKIESLKRERDIIEKGETNRKEIFDIVEYLDRSRKDNSFVYFTYDELKKILPHLNKDYQVLALFLFDSIVRSPSEISNIYVNDLSFEGDDVYVTVREEISKTYARKFNLILCEDALKEYIQRNKLGPDDVLFPFYKMPTFNKTMQKAFIKVFGDVMTEGQKSFSEITGYAFRHSGACHLRSLKGISMDKLMVRGGWASLKRINYYTRFLGCDGRIDKEDIINQSSLNEDLIRLVESQNKEMAELRQKLTQLLEMKMPDGITIEKTPLRRIEVAQNV